MPLYNSEPIILSEINSLNPDEYEKKYVHDTYNIIASQFSNSRYKPWDKVKSFLEKLTCNSIMVDVGCGNGKNLGISRGKSIGCDICPNLLEIAKNKGFDVKLADTLNLPFEDNFADAVISIAVIHHLSTKERRLNAIKELIRICKPNGKILIYVWANNEKKNGDSFIKWGDSKGNNNNFTRYYHLFDENELDNLCLEVGNCKIENSYFDKENWAIILSKI
jgi:SAM-dependent methyltransferase